MSALWCVHTSRRQAPAKQQSQPQPQRRPAAGDSQQPFAAVRSIIATSANMITSPFFARPFVASASRSNPSGISMSTEGEKESGEGESSVCGLCYDLGCDAEDMEFFDCGE